MHNPDLEAQYVEEARKPRIEYRDPDLHEFCDSVTAFLDAMIDINLKEHAKTIFYNLVDAQAFLDKDINNYLVSFEEFIRPIAHIYRGYRGKDSETRRSVVMGELRKMTCERRVDELHADCDAQVAPFEPPKITPPLTDEQIDQELVLRYTNELAPRKTERHPECGDLERYEHLDYRDPPQKIRRGKPVYIEQLRADMQREVDTVVLPREDNSQGRVVAINRLRDVLQSRIRHAFVARSVVRFEQVQSAAAEVGLGALQLEDEDGDRLDLRSVCKIPAEKSYNLEMRLNQTVFAQRGFIVEVDDDLGIICIGDSEGDIGRVVICYTGGRPNGYALFMKATEGEKLDDSLGEIDDMKRLLSNRGVLVQIAEKMLRAQITIDSVLLKRLATHLDKNVASIAGHKKSDRLIHALTVDPELRKVFIDNIEIFFALLSKANGKSVSLRKRNEKDARKASIHKFQMDELKRIEEFDDKGKRQNNRTTLKQDYPITRGIPRQPKRMSREIEENPDLARFANY